METRSKFSPVAFSLLSFSLQTKQQHNASFPRAVSNVFLYCPQHNRQAVLFGAHPGKPCGCWSFGTDTASPLPLEMLL